MATQDKLLKSLEILRNYSTPNQTFDLSNKKIVVHHCHVVTEAISNPTIKIATNFHTYLSITIEVLLQLCDIQETDIRMTAEECLNRIIRAMMTDGNIGKVQIELHKAIKKNGPARSLRAALWRFSQLAHLIRPHKGKPYVANLLPTIMKITERTEEQVHETLANSLPKIMQVLGNFTSDNEIKILLKSFVANISNQSTSIRRTSSNSILCICLNCRKPYVFIKYIINLLIDLLIPVNDSHSNYLILGVMTCLKTVLPHLNNSQATEELRGSFGIQNQVDLTSISTDKLLQIYELCLHYFSHKDHNIVNASLETFNVLLQNSSTELKKILTCQNGINKSRIFFTHSSSLSPSQLSVATHLTNEENLFIETELTETIHTDIEKWIGESKLSVMNITFANTSNKSKENIEKSQSLDSTSSLATVSSDFGSFDYNIIDINKSEGLISGVKSQSIEDNLERLTVSENSSEKSFLDDERNLDLIDIQEIFTGTFLDKEIPLIYATRLITKSFLLSGYPGIYIPDKTIKISVKSLAISCLSTIFQIYPKTFLLYLDKNYANNTKNNSKISNQQISEILLFNNHNDPQLRGAIRLMVAHFIRTILIENEYDYSKWLANNSIVTDLNQLQMKKLITILIKGLEDESSNCTRQTLISLNISLGMIAESYNKYFIKPILVKLPFLAENPYWLVKVALCELVSKLSYVTLHNITSSSQFQNKVIDCILFEFLQSDDMRLRSASAQAICKIIPHLYCEEFQIKHNTVITKAIYYKNLYLSNLFYKENEINLDKTHLIDNMPFPFSELTKISCDKIEFTLAKIINKLYQYLLTSTSKYFIYGCIETLSLLSNTYPTTVYTKAWNCKSNFNENCDQFLNLSTDLLNYCLNLLNYSIICYDLTCHYNILNLISNLYAGYSLAMLKPLSDVENTSKLWDMFVSKKFGDLSEQYLTHMIKLLNIFHHVLDEIVPIHPQTKTVLPNLPSASTLSPIKRRKSDLDKKLISPGKSSAKDEKSERKESIKINSISSFIHLPHYMKIYEILRSSYINYKISLESEACENFLNLLRQTLQSFSVIMEVASLIEFQRIADEILNYFRSTFSLEATTTVECVQQLLKCLFGTNLTANISEIISNKRNDDCDLKREDMYGFYSNLSQKPYNDISLCINSLNNINKIECDGDITVMGYLHRKTVKKQTNLTRSSDKVLANYIRIFEPMVIKSLKYYTITSNIKLQCRVLQLLSQLIQLRVNYCLLDSEQIFIGFVLKQFEYIEEGQIPFANQLIQKIFQFLVQLSYSKQHSKSIISIPKIIQLCDGLMASGQSPLTHCIPALEPIVEDIFLIRNKANTFDLKELETTREVLLSLLLRLIEYHEIIDLIVLILDDSKYYSDNPEKWLRWSNQIFNVLLPMLKQNKIRLDSSDDYISLKKLIFVLNPKVFIPIDNILMLLFQDPLLEDGTFTHYNRWLSKILIVFLIISLVKEEVLISKIEELKKDFSPENIFENITPTADPLNVTNSSNIFDHISPEIIFIRFLFRIINLISKKCIEIAKNQEENCLIEKFSIFLMHCLHIFQSGSHCRIANYAITLINRKHSSVDHRNFIKLDVINDNFLQLSTYYPTLTNQWCYFLIHLNYNSKKFWSQSIQLRKVHDSDEALCINSEIVQVGSSILFCDYMVSVT